jgi:hypothetical protein
LDDRFCSKAGASEMKKLLSVLAIALALSGAAHGQITTH